MRLVDYQRGDGRWFKVWLPDDAPDSEAFQGIVAGPPEMPFELSTEASVRLHNELFWAGVITFEDAVRKRDRIVYALQVALGIDAELVMVVYKEG